MNPNQQHGYPPQNQYGADKSSTTSQISYTQPNSQTGQQQPVLQQPNCQHLPNTRSYNRPSVGQTQNAGPNYLRQTGQIQQRPNMGVQTYQSQQYPQQQFNPTGGQGYTSATTSTTTTTHHGVQHYQQPQAPRASQQHYTTNQTQLQAQPQHQNQQTQLPAPSILSNQALSYCQFTTASKPLSVTTPAQHLVQRSNPVQNSSNLQQTTVRTTSQTRAEVGGQARQAAAAKGETELKIFDNRVQTLLKSASMGVCVMGFNYYRGADGYLCGGGSHFIPHESVDAMMLHGVPPAVEIVNWYFVNYFGGVHFAPQMVAPPRDGWHEPMHMDPNTRMAYGWGPVPLKHDGTRWHL